MSELQPSCTQNVQLFTRAVYLRRALVLILQRPNRTVFVHWR